MAARDRIALFPMQPQSQALFVKLTFERSNVTEKSRKNQLSNEAVVVVGVSIGVAIGALIGTYTGNVALSVSLGTSFGMVGSCIYVWFNSKQDSRDD